MKKTVKQKLVEYMIENGNDFTYTEMIKALLLINYGPDLKYDWKEHRGYHATNFGSRGYMASGVGTCGVYKNDSGKWSAKFFTKQEMLEHRIKSTIDRLTSLVRYDSSRITNRLHFVTNHLHRMNLAVDHRKNLAKFKNDAIKNITKQIQKLK